ncbi:MAG: Wzz/FepE/Etk N-terminal domain-containing protein, partial [Saprospiraceae bacterium]
MEYSKENLLDVIRVLFKWKRPITITCLCVAVLAVVISLLVPVYYTATTIFYPASPSLQSPSVIFGETNSELYFYGGSADTDRLLQAARSNELYDHMIKTFNLYGHYDIDSTGSKASYKVRMKLSKLYELVKNERDAVELSITDTDQVMSAQMANSARIKINEIANNLIKQSQKDIILSFEAQIKDKEQMLKTVSDSLSFLQGKYGIYDAFSTKKMIGSAIPSLKSGIVSEKARLESYKGSKGSRDSIQTIQARILGMEKMLESYTEGEFGEGIGFLPR